MTAEADALLVINAGSSSIKVAVFGNDLGQMLAASASGIGTRRGRLKVGDEAQDAGFDDHETALRCLLEGLERADYPLARFRAAAHRVVHGGTELVAPVRIDDDVLAGIDRCAELAPLHNPHNIAAIRALSRLAPEMPQYASFDTAFHATMPAVARRYAVPSEIESRGIRRYGFHGISYAALTRALPRLSDEALPGRLLAFHLGNGASLCAIRDGQSVATTMGYSPVEGLTMGTRSGDIDANAVLRLAEEDGIEAAQHLLNHESGLKGLSGTSSDMQRLLDQDDVESRFAVDHFCYWALRHAGAMIAAMEGLDAVAFTGGIGENAAQIRARLLEGLRWTGLKPDMDANEAGEARLSAPGARISAWIVPAEEERVIARDALSLLEAT